MASDQDDIAELTAQVARRAGQKITAIKLWRERTGLGLAEAKDQMDDLERRLGQ